MDAQSYLTHARAAQSAVRRYMTLGASNKTSDLLTSAGRSISCVDEIQKFPRLFGYVELVREFATRAKNAGCGNCMEQAAIAFIDLFDQHVLPVDLMASERINHTFVVIGRVKTSEQEHPETWGPDAVVCDPWDEKAYPASEIQEKMWHARKDFSPRSYCRVD